MLYQLNKRKRILPSVRFALRPLRQFLLSPTNIIRSWDNDINMSVYPHDRRILVLINGKSVIPKVGTVVHNGNEDDYDIFLVSDVQLLWVTDSMKGYNLAVDYVGPKPKKTVKIEIPYS
jgi:hypothetical protein